MGSERNQAVAAFTLSQCSKVGSAAAIAARYSLGADAVLSGPVARGEQGQVWRITTARGAWAVKEPFERQVEADAQADADFQDAVRAAGVPMPRVVRTADGDVLADLGSVAVRVYEWVDLLAPDIGLDPTAVGRAVGLLHRVRFSAAGPVDPWHTDAVGAARWDELVHLLDARGAPFADDLARVRDEIVAVEALLEAPRDLQTCHCDLWADNVLGTPSGSVCVIDWENCGPADPSQELGMVMFEFAPGTRVGRAPSTRPTSTPVDPAASTGPATSRWRSRRRVTSPRWTVNPGSIRTRRRPSVNGESARQRVHVACAPAR